MKCIKENCKFNFISCNLGFCEVIGSFVHGEEPECVLSDKILQVENELREYQCALDKIIMFHYKNDKKEVKQ